MSRILGLRIDVDTHEGMRDGVPRLLKVLGEAGVMGTFYFAMGPDRSGLAIVNVFTRPGFLRKMLKSGAPKIYSLRTMLSGTLLPSRPVATAFPDILRRAEQEGHETGVHAWDHRRWQDRLERFRKEETVLELEQGARAYAEILARKPRTFAAPAWYSCADSVLHQEGMGLTYASDCRGAEPFLPVIEGRVLSTPQVPATLPTLDETLGGRDRDATAFFDRMLVEAAEALWPVLTIHAELEGGPFAADFAAFLAKAREAGIQVAPLKDLLAARIDTTLPLPCCQMSYGTVPGRHGRVSIQVPVT
jgi:undecaprenyl phosphate-alpha-L-ara4FN deformylase